MACNWGQPDSSWTHPGSERDTVNLSQYGPSFWVSISLRVGVWTQGLGCGQALKKTLDSFTSGPSERHFLKPMSVHEISYRLPGPGKDMRYDFCLLKWCSADSLRGSRVKA